MLIAVHIGMLILFGFNIVTAVITYKIGIRISVGICIAVCMLMAVFCQEFIAVCIGYALPNAGIKLRTAIYAFVEIGLCQNGVSVGILLGLAFNSILTRIVTDTVIRNRQAFGIRAVLLQIPGVGCVIPIVAEFVFFRTVIFVQVHKAALGAGVFDDLVPYAIHFLGQVFFFKVAVIISPAHTG